MTNSAFLHRHDVAASWKDDFYHLPRPPQRSWATLWCIPSFAITYSASFTRSLSSTRTRNPTEVLPISALQLSRLLCLLSCRFWNAARTSQTSLYACRLACDVAVHPSPKTTTARLGVHYVKLLRALQPNKRRKGVSFPCKHQSGVVWRIHSAG